MAWLTSAYRSLFSRNSAVQASSLWARSALVRRSWGIRSPGVAVIGLSLRPTFQLKSDWDAIGPEGIAHGYVSPPVGGGRLRVEHPPGSPQFFGFRASWALGRDAG